MSVDTERHMNLYSDVCETESAILLVTVQNTDCILSQTNASVTVVVVSGNTRNV